tara:strand:+ start:67 stop:639 length:573 start_codon:yes stop_codon:yes gene_type:complete
MVKEKACVFISGKGSNLKNLIKKTRDYNFPISIKLVVCDNINAPGLIYAKKNSIPYLLIDTNLRSFENKLLMELKKYKITLICLAGYMKIISKKFISNFRKKIINIHPSLLPKFKGLNTFTRVLRNNEVKTGCTVHHVNPKVDTGKIIVQKTFFINKNDNEEILKIKTQQLEYLAFPEAIIKIFQYKIKF